MSHTDSTDDTDLSPLDSEAKHELLEVFTNTNFSNKANEPDGL